MILKKPLKISEILEEFKNKELLSLFFGSTEKEVTHIVAAEDASPGSLVFLANEKIAQDVCVRKPACIITSEKIKNFITPSDEVVILISSNLNLAHALIRQKFAARDFSETGWEGIHPSCIVHETAQIGTNSIIEPKVVIGKNAVIGKNSRIMAGSILENDVKIGDNVVIHPNVVVGYNCEVGSESVIGSGTVIGSDGFGFAQDSKGKSYPIPQTGRVIIEERVRIGSNCSIDRAAYRETRIGSGTKIDNLCHIAHNVEIGEDCLLTAMLCVAGSTKIGNRVMTSGQTGILDHLTIADGVVLLHRAGVTKNLTEPGAYAGLPLQKLPEYMKNMAVLKNAVDLKKKIQEVESKIEKT